MLYSYSFSNKKRDLSDVLSAVIKDEPRFISNFCRVSNARCQKHEWIEDHLQGCRITPSSCRDGELLLSSNDVAKLRVGTKLCKKNDPALFVVTRLDSVSATVRLDAANGSDLTTDTLPFGSTSFNIISTPESDEHEEEVSISQWNATQVFHKRIEVGGKDLASNFFGSADNQLNRKTAFALADLARDLNRVALFGNRIVKSDDAKGEAGGLYYFATGEDALERARGGLYTRISRTIPHRFFDAKRREMPRRKQPPGRARSGIHPARRSGGNVRSRHGVRRLATASAG